jgi:hypothetical protein
MSKAKKGPAKKAKKGGKKQPMRPAYMAAKKPSASKSGPSPSSALAELQAQVNWLLDAAKEHGWGTP